MPKIRKQQAALGVLEELMRQGKVSLIVPYVVVDEFARNTARILNESQRSLSGILKRAKQVIDQVGDAKRKRIVLEQLNEVDHKLPSLGESAWIRYGGSRSCRGRRLPEIRHGDFK